MNMRFWGVRGSVPVPRADHLRYGGNTMCVEIGSSDPCEPILIDCGTGARDLGNELLSRSRSLRVHLFLTHFHWDHIQGLPFFAPLFEPKAEIVIYSHREEHEVRGWLGLQMSSPFFPLSLSEASARLRFRRVVPAEVLHASGIRVSYFPLHHPQGAVGYRFEQSGTVLVHACDHECGVPEIDDGIRRAAHQASMLVMDAQYTPEEYATRKGWGHGSYAQATHLAQESGAEKLVLIHHDPAHDDDFLDRMQDQAQRLFAPTMLAREGDAPAIQAPASARRLASRP